MSFSYESMLNKLQHPNSEIKKRAMENLLNKFSYGLFSIDKFANDEELMIQLVKWFNNNPCFHYRQVSQLLEEFTKREASCKILVNLGASTFFQTLKPYAPEDIHKIIDRILYNIQNCRIEMKQHSALEERKEIEERTQEEVNNNMSEKRYLFDLEKQKYESKPIIQSTIRREFVSQLNEDDKQYLYGINIKLQQKNIGIIKESLELLLIILSEFPIDVFLHNTDIFKSLLTLTFADKGTNIDRLSLDCLQALFSKSALKVKEFESNPNFTFIGDDKIIYFFRLCITKLLNVLSSRLDLIGKIIDVLKSCIKCLPTLKTLEHFTLIGNSEGMFSELVTFIEKIDYVSGIKLVDLLICLIDKVDRSLWNSLPESVFTILERFLFDPFLFLSYPQIHSKILGQVEQMNKDKYRSFESAKQSVSSLFLLEEMSKEEDESLGDIQQHLIRLESVFPALGVKAEKLIIEKYLQELFLCAEFLEDCGVCIEILRKLLTHPNANVRQFTYDFIEEDQQFFLDKLASDEILYILCLQLCFSEDPKPTRLVCELLKNSPNAVKKIFPYSPLLQTSINGNTKSKTCDMIGCLQLLERVMDETNVLIYNLRFLYHKQKWLREMATTNLQFVLTKKGVFKQGETKEMDPLNNTLNDIYLIEDEMRPSNNTDYLSIEQVDSLLQLFVDTEEDEIVSSVIPQLILIAKERKYYAYFDKPQFIDCLFDRIFSSPSSLLTKLLSLFFLLNREINLSEKLLNNNSRLLIFIGYIFDQNVEIRKYSLLIIYGLVFKYDYFLRRFPSVKVSWENIAIHQKDLSIDSKNLEKFVLPSFLEHSYFSILPSYTYNIDFGDSTLITTKALEFINTVKLFKEGSLKTNENFKQVYPEFVIQGLLNKLNSSRSHNEFLNSLQKLRDFVVYDIDSLEAFEKSEWRNTFLRFLLLNPSSEDDDKVLESILLVLNDIAKRGFFDKDVIAEFGFPFCKNFKDILQIQKNGNTILVIERESLRLSLLTLLSTVLDRLCEEECYEDIKLIINDVDLLQCLQMYMEQNRNYNLKLLASRCLVSATVKPTVISLQTTDTILNLISFISHILENEKQVIEKESFEKSYFISLCAQSLSTLATVLNLHNISWIEHIPIGFIVELLFMKNTQIRSAGFQLLFKGVLEPDHLRMMIETNSKLFEMVLNRVMNTQENIFVRAKAFWFYSQIVDILLEIGSVSIWKIMGISEEYDEKLILNIVPLQQLMSLADQSCMMFMETLTTLILTIVCKAQSLHSKLFEFGIWNRLLLFVRNTDTLTKINELKPLEEKKENTVQYLQSVTNIMHIVYEIIEPQPPLAYYFASETGLISSLVEWLFIELEFSNLFEESFSVREMALTLLNDIFFHLKKDKGLDPVMILGELCPPETKNNILKGLAKCLDSSNPNSIRISATKFISTLIAAEEAPIDWFESENGKEITLKLCTLFEEYQEASSLNVPDIMEGLILIGKALSSILSLSNECRVVACEKEMIDMLLNYTKSICSSLKVEGLKKNEREIVKIPKDQHVQLLNNFSLFQHLFICEDGKSIAIELGILKELKTIWFSNYIDASLRYSIITTLCNLCCNNQRTKIELVVDANKTQDKSLLFDIINRTQSPKSKLTNIFMSFKLLSILSSSEEIRSCLMKHQLIQKLISTMKEQFIKKKDDPRIEYCLYFLASLSFYIDSQDVFLSSDTIHHLITQLQFTTNNNTKEYLLIILRNLLFTKDYKIITTQIEDIIAIFLKTSIKSTNRILIICIESLWIMVSLFMETRKLLRKATVLDCLKEMEKKLIEKHHLEMFNKMMKYISEL